MGEGNVFSLSSSEGGVTQLTQPGGGAVSQLTQSEGGWVSQLGGGGVGSADSARGGAESAKIGQQNE